MEPLSRFTYELPFSFMTVFMRLRASAGRPKELKPKASWKLSMVLSMNPP